MGNGAVAFTARPGAVIWQSKHSRGNRADNPISATSLLHACMGSNPNFARTDDSLSLTRAYRKHAGHARPHRHRHRLHGTRLPISGSIHGHVFDKLPSYYWFGDILLLVCISGGGSMVGIAALSQPFLSRWCWCPWPRCWDSQKLE